jgi:hypothetical protein
MKPFIHTVSVKPLPPYRLQVEFDNGVAGEVYLSQELWGEMFEPLKDQAMFMTAHQDQIMETVVWANGADLAPEFLFDLMQKQNTVAA